MSTNDYPNRKVVLLPQEVLDLIIDALALDSNPADESRSAGSWRSDSSTVTLARCMLVSSSFYAKARPLVFRSIVWREQILPCEKWNDGRDNRFFDIFRDYNVDNTLASGLFATPPVNLVRSLLLVVCFPRTPRMVTFDGWSLPQSELNDRREVFPALLEQMVNISEFTVMPCPGGASSSDIRGEGNTFTGSALCGKTVLYWKTLLLWHRSLKKEINRVCRTARVLRFEDISQFPLSLVGACENLRSLSLSSISSVDDDLYSLSLKSQAKVKNQQKSGDYLLPRPATGLEKLEHLSTNMVESDFFVKILGSRPEAFSVLSRLRIVLPSESESSERYWTGEQALLQACGASLKVLEIESPASTFSYPPNFISHLTSLHTLTLRSTITTSLLPESFPPEMMTFFITDLVSSPSGSTSPSTLVELTLELRLDAPNLGLDLTDRVEIVPKEWERRWSRLDGVLAGPAFPLLERLNVKFLERLQTVQTTKEPVEMTDANLNEEINHVEDLEIMDNHPVDSAHHGATPKMDTTWIASLEETSLAWLRRYVEGALPKVSASSERVIQLEYRIFANDAPFPSWDT